MAHDMYPASHQLGTTHVGTFHYQYPTRAVWFGPGMLAELGHVLAGLDIGRVFAFVTPSQRPVVERLRRLLGNSLAGISFEVHQRVPIEIAHAGRDAVRHAAADGLLAIGGGSAIGLAKAIATMIELPIVAVPTTYSGSEMTDIYGITIEGRKEAHHDSRVQPRGILYDPELTMSLPPQLTASSGTNALAQAIGSLYAGGNNPISVLMAGDGIHRLLYALPACVADPTDQQARADALLGAHLAGTALAAAGLSAHHALAHALGDLTQLPHASIHAALLPQTTHWAIGQYPETVAPRLRTSFSSRHPEQVLFDFLLEIGVPTGLRQLGLSQQSFDTACSELRRTMPEPWRNCHSDEFDNLLTRTYFGTRPDTLNTL